MKYKFNEKPLFDNCVQKYEYFWDTLHTTINLIFNYSFKVNKKNPKKILNNNKTVSTVKSL